MTDETGAGSETQSECFAVQRKTLLALHLESVNYLGIMAFVLYLPTKVEGGYATGATGGTAVFLWGLLAVGVALPLALAAWRWPRTPRGATRGVLEIGARGLVYAVGPYRREILWDEVAALHPVLDVQQRKVVGVYLSRVAKAEPGSARDFVLRKAMRWRLFEPVEREDGTILPLVIFGAGKTDAILRAIKAGLRQADDKAY